MPCVPAFKLCTNCRERFVIKLPPQTLKLLAVGKTIDGRLPRAIVDAPALSEEDRNTHICKGRKYGDHKYTCKVM